MGPMAGEGHHRALPCIGYTIAFPFFIELSGAQLDERFTSLT
jgi:hypothetical protein